MSPAAPVAPIALPPVAAATSEQLKAAQAAIARLAILNNLGDINQANAATGLYGDTGTGKSVLVDTAMEYCWNRYHKISRVVSADLGGFGNKRLRLIRLGICQVYNPLNHIEPFETMEDLSRGYWPETILDPYTGFAAPDVKLIAPERTTWTVYCPQGHAVKALNSKGSLNGFQVQCPDCKTITTTQNWSRVEEATTRNGWIKHVGLYAFDSGTALADWAMEDMSDAAARTPLGTKDGNQLTGTGGRILSGKYAFGSSTQPHYGFAQNMVRRVIKNSRLIPGMAMPPIWTFLEDRGGDENKGISVFGPKIPGSAKTSIVPSWLGNCLHTTKEANGKGIDKHRLYLVNHTDRNSNVPHLAKTRAEPGTLPAFLEDVDPTNQQDLPEFTRFSLGYFFDQLEHALDLTAKADADFYTDAPVFVPLVIEDETLAGKDLSGAETGIRAGGARAVPATRPTATRVVAGRPAVMVGPAAPKPTPASQPAATTSPRPATTAQVLPSPPGSGVVSVAVQTVPAPAQAPVPSAPSARPPNAPPLPLRPPNALVGKPLSPVPAGAAPGAQPAAKRPEAPGLTPAVPVQPTAATPVTATPAVQQALPVASQPATAQVPAGKPPTPSAVPARPAGRMPPPPGMRRT